MAGAGILIAAALVLLLAPSALADNDPGAGGGTVSGDWIVRDGRSYSGVTITVRDGNLYIQNNGQLTLNNVLLRFDSTTDGAYSLKVEKGGTLVTGQRTNISSTNINVHYRFVVEGTLTMDLSHVSETWGDTASWAGGVQLYSDSVSITNSTVFQGKTGGISIFNCSPTIDANTVRNNGQGGLSQVYCYGIYMYGSQSNLSNNQIHENTYWAPDSYSTSSNQYPYPGEYYSHYYNGNYYYGYPGYWYRYGYYYIYSQSRYYGTGVMIEGGSAVTLFKNNIHHNGVGKVAPQYGYLYTSTYEGYGYGTSSYYYYQGWGDHYAWSYNYFYIGNRDFGRGVHCENSVLEFVGNTLDENGFESTHDYWPNSPYVCWHAGVALTMLNCQGNITQNTIQNSAILANLTGCTVTIDGNKFTGDYVGTAASYYSANFIPWRTAYGVKAERCTIPLFANNTVYFKFKDYNYYVNNANIYFADLLVALDLPQGKDCLIKGNKITMDCLMYGQLPCIGINLSLKSTGIQLIDTTIEYKYTPQYSSGYTPVMQKLMQMTLKSAVVVENCTFKGIGQAASGAPVVTGILANYGSSVALYNSSVTNCDHGVTVTDYGILDIQGCKMTGVTRQGITVEQLTKAVVRASTASGNGIGVRAIKSTIDIFNSTMNDPTEFYLDKAASVNVYNTAHVKNAAILIDNASYLNVSWPVTIRVQWQNEVPVEGASLTFQTIAGATVYQGTTGPDGIPAPLIWMKEYTGHNRVVTKYTPHRVTASKGRAAAMELFIIDKPTDIAFRLIDGVAPDLVVTYPFDGQMLNDPLVTIKGQASDPEAGLLDGLVWINIDNQGWIPLAVTDERWTYTRVVGDGAHVVRVKAEDLVGNTARFSFSFSIDTTAPALHVFSPTDGCYTNQRTITVSGISEVNAFISVNGLAVGLDKRYFSTQISLEDGPNTVTVSASDAGGNSRTVTLRVTLDTVAPLLEITSPARDSFLNQDPVSVLGTTEPTAQVRVNGYPAQLSGTNFEALVDLSEGTNTVTVTAVDLAGNLNTITFTLNLDTSLPDLTLFTPRDELWTNLTRVMVSGATESGASVTINGQNTNVVNTVFSNYVTLAEGANRVVVVARDPAGNRHSVSRTVYLDTRTPDLVLTSPAERAVLPSRVVPILGSVDWGADVKVNGVRVAVTDFVFSTTAAFTEDGTQVIEVTATDLAGNTAVVARTLTLDTSTPEIMLSYPDDAMKVKLKAITVTGQTEPYSTVVVNTETILQVGRDGLFAVPVLLEDGENRITITTTDAAGNTASDSRTIFKAVKKEAPKEDTSWMMNLTGLLIGIGVALPIATFALTDSWRRRRTRVLAEIEAAEAERRQREELARRPTVERVGKKRAREPEPPKPEEPRPPVEPPKLAEPPKPEAAPVPEAVKVGLKDRSGAADASAEETEAPTKIDTPKATEAPKAEEPPASPEAGLKDKGSEAEGAAGETEVRTK